MISNRLINTKEGIVEYSSCGSGIPILFVHGGHVNSQFTLPYKGIDLQKCNLITPSRPGYGKTPLGNNKTPGQTAKLFIALLDALNIKKVIVYGTSAGGLTALEIAAHFPDRVDKLILVSAVTMDWLDKKGKTYRGAKIIFNPNVEWLTWGMVRLLLIISPTLLVKSFFSNLSTASANNLPIDEVSELAGLLRTFRSKRGFINDIDQTINVGILRQIKCSTLVLHSRFDNSVSIEHAENAKKEIPNSKLYVLDNFWGHMIWIGKDYKIAGKLILDFIN